MNTCKISCINTDVRMKSCAVSYSKGSPEDYLDDYSTFSTQASGTMIQHDLVIYDDTVGLLTCSYYIGFNY
jgi:hypothetical protein